MQQQHGVAGRAVALPLLLIAAHDRETTLASGDAAGVEVGAAALAVDGHACGCACWAGGHVARVSTVLSRAGQHAVKGCCGSPAEMPGSQ